MNRFALRTVIVACAFALWMAAAVYTTTERRLSSVREVPAVALAIPSGEAALERGRHLVHAVAQCTTCHGADLAGSTLADDLWLGRLDAPNLTPGAGGIAGRDAASLERAIRHGVKADGRPALVMPAHHLQALRDEDVAAIIAYLRTLPGVDRQARPRWVGPFTRLVAFAGAAPELIAAEIIEHDSVGSTVPPGVNAEYGAYLVEIGACRVCHGAALEGGLHPLALPGEPPPPRLAAGGAIADWDKAAFLRAMREGRTPDGRSLDPRFMPWPAIAKMEEAELAAIWRYLRSLETPEVASR